MEIEIKIDAACTEPKVIIVTSQMTGEIKRLVEQIQEGFPQVISGFKDDRLEVLEPSDLIRIYANAGKVYAVTENGEYLLRLRLYELEKRLDKKTFVRISHSEIINLKKAEYFDLNFAGTICVKLSNRQTTYVSRRYVPQIKQVLGI